MANFKEGKYAVLFRIIDGYLTAHSPEFGIMVTRKFDEIHRMEDAGRLYFDLLKKITEEIARRKTRGEQIPEAKKPLDLIPKGESPTLSTNDVASALRVSPATVRRLADSGTLKSKNSPGGHRRFKLSDVEAYERAREGLDEASNASLGP